MIMYCRDCKDNQRVEKIRDKDIFSGKSYWKCKKCGVIVLEVNDGLYLIGGQKIL